MEPHPFTLNDWLLMVSGREQLSLAVYKLLSLRPPSESSTPIITHVALANLSGPQNKTYSHEWKKKFAGRRDVVRSGQEVWRENA